MKRTGKKHDDSISIQVERIKMKSIPHMLWNYEAMDKTTGKTYRGSAHCKRSAKRDAVERILHSRCIEGRELLCTECEGECRVPHSG